jgi:hypothetical protein
MNGLHTILSALCAALRALVSPADAAALLRPTRGRYEPYPVDPDDPVLSSRRSSLEP